MFDAENTKVLEGTVKEFQWTNLRSWILITVSNAQGQAEQWAIEMGGPWRFGAAGQGSQNPYAWHENQDGHSSAS